MCLRLSLSTGIHEFIYTQNMPRGYIQKTPNSSQFWRKLGGWGKGVGVRLVFY